MPAGFAQPAFERVGKKKNAKKENEKSEETGVILFRGKH